MAQPTTATEIALFTLEAKRRLQWHLEEMRQIFYPRFVDMMFVRRRRRPHTDDMLQMLDDLGIEPAEHFECETSFSW